MTTTVLQYLGTLLTLIVSNWITWFLSRRKYNSEVDGTLIKNLQESLAFYTKVCDDNQRRLEENLVKIKQQDDTIELLRKQVEELKSQVLSIKRH